MRRTRRSWASPKKSIFPSLAHPKIRLLSVRPLHCYPRWSCPSSCSCWLGAGRRRRRRWNPKKAASMECRTAAVSRDGLVRVYRNAVFAFRSPNWMQINRIYMEWSSLDVWCLTSHTPPRHLQLRTTATLVSTLRLHVDWDGRFWTFSVVLFSALQNSLLDWTNERTNAQTLFSFSSTYVLVCDKSTRHVSVRLISLSAHSLFITHHDISGTRI